MKTDYKNGFVFHKVYPGFFSWGKRTEREAGNRLPSSAKFEN